MLGRHARVPVRSRCRKRHKHLQDPLSRVSNKSKATTLARTDQVLNQRKNAPKTCSQATMPPLGISAMSNSCFSVAELFDERTESSERSTTLNWTSSFLDDKVRVDILFQMMKKKCLVEIQCQAGSGAHLISRVTWRLLDSIKRTKRCFHVETQLHMRISGAPCRLKDCLRCPRVGRLLFSVRPY